MRALVVLVALLLTGCVGQLSTPTAVESVPPPGKATASPTQADPAIAPAPPPQVTAPPAPGHSASPPGPGPSGPVPGSQAPTTPEILYVKTHLANFRNGAGTNMKILRVLRQGARLHVLEARNSWLRVRLDDGQEGWVAESVTSATAPVTPVRAPTRRGPSEITRA